LLNGISWIIERQRLAFFCARAPSRQSYLKIYYQNLVLPKKGYSFVEATNPKKHEKEQLTFNSR
jgi:hypothetical protein